MFLTAENDSTCKVQKHAHQIKWFTFHEFSRLEIVHFQFYDFSRSEYTLNK